MNLFAKLACILPGGDRVCEFGGGDGGNDDKNQLSRFFFLRCLRL